MLINHRYFYNNNNNNNNNNKRVLDCNSCVCTRNEETRGGERWLLGGIEKCIKICEDRGKLVIIGDIYARVDDSEVGGVAGKFGVSGANENGRKLRCVRKRD